MGNFLYNARDDWPNEGEEGKSIKFIITMQGNQKSVDEYRNSNQPVVGTELTTFVKNRMAQTAGAEPLLNDLRAPLLHQREMYRWTWPSCEFQSDIVRG